MIAGAGPAPVRVGVLGLGKIARTRFIPAALRCPLVAVTAIGTRRAHELDARAVGLDPGVRLLSPEALFQEGKAVVDAVYIALPNDLHTAAVRSCAEAGLHVLCEKPLSSRLSEALACRKRCLERGVLFAEAFAFRHDSRQQRVLELIRAGVIGELRLFEATFSYFLDDLTNIRLMPEREGGALMDVGCYGVDAARLLFGAEPIAALGYRTVDPRSGVDDLTAATLVFPGRALATITASTRLARQHTYRARGTAGSIVVPFAFNPKDDDPREILIERAGDSPWVESCPPTSTFDAQILHFARAVQAGELRMRWPTEDGVANAAVLDALHRSLREGRVIELGEEASGVA